MNKGEGEEARDRNILGEDPSLSNRRHLSSRKATMPESTSERSQQCLWSDIFIGDIIDLVHFVLRANVLVRMNVYMMLM
jgi:hypothetical protein